MDSSGFIARGHGHHGMAFRSRIRRRAPSIAPALRRASRGLMFSGSVARAEPSRRRLDYLSGCKPDPGRDRLVHVDPCTLNIGRRHECRARVERLDRAGERGEVERLHLLKAAAASVLEVKADASDTDRVIASIPPLDRD